MNGDHSLKRKVFALLMNVLYSNMQTQPKVLNLPNYLVDS